MCWERTWLAPFQMVAQTRPGEAGPQAKSVLLPGSSAGPRRYGRLRRPTADRNTHTRRKRAWLASLRILAQTRPGEAEHRADRVLLQGSSSGARRYGRLRRPTAGLTTHMRRRWARLAALQLSAPTRRFSEILVILGPLSCTRSRPGAGAPGYPSAPTRRGQEQKPGKNPGHKPAESRGVIPSKGKGRPLRFKFYR